MFFRTCHAARRSLYCFSLERVRSIQTKVEEKGVLRCKELIISLHNPFHIAQFQLVVAVELLDDFTIFMPVIGPAGPKDVWRLRGDGGCVIIFHGEGEV